MKRRAFIRNAAGLLVTAGFPGIIRAAGFSSGNRGLGGDDGFILRPWPTAAPASYIAYASGFALGWVRARYGLTGCVDGKTGIFSGWIKPRVDDCDRVLISTTSNAAYSQFQVYLNAANKVEIYGADIDSTIILTLTSNGTYTTASGWIHIYGSWDLSTGRAVLYVNGANDLASGSLLTNAAINYTSGSFLIGLNDNSMSTDIELCEMYFNSAAYLDDPSKFIAGGKPISLGSTGSLPTGTAPVLYLKNPYDSFATNSGTGGNLGFMDASLTQETPP